MAAAVAARGLFPVEVVADVLGVARSNRVEQMRRAPRSRGPYRRADDEAVLIAIRAIMDVRPTYGYRRVTAILNRRRRATGEPALHHKRVFRLMKRDSLLLQRHTGGRPVRAREGRVIAPVWLGSAPGSPTTTNTIPTVVSACARRASSSVLRCNQPRVRF